MEGLFSARSISWSGFMV